MVTGALLERWEPGYQRTELGSIQQLHTIWQDYQEQSLMQTDAGVMGLIAVRGGSGLPFGIRREVGSAASHSIQWAEPKSMLPSLGSLRAPKADPCDDYCQNRIQPK
jgi:hypothetical protein